jgi:hypothetical protein
VPPVVHSIDADAVLSAELSQLHGLTVPTTHGDIKRVTAIHRLLMVRNPLAILGRVPLVHIDAFQFKVIRISVGYCPFLERRVGRLPFFANPDASRTIVLERRVVYIVAPTFHRFPYAMEPCAGITM